MISRRRIPSHPSSTPCPSVVATPAHTGTTLTLVLTSTLNQGAGDESWGVDNVSIMIR